MALSSLRAVAFLAAIFLLSACSSGPEATVKAFYKALDKADAATASGYLSAGIVQVFGEQKLQAGLDELAAKMSRCGGLDTVDVVLSGEGDTRHGTTTVHFAGECRVEENTVIVVKEDGDWKLGLGK